MNALLRNIRIDMQLRNGKSPSQSMEHAAEICMWYVSFSSEKREKFAKTQTDCMQRVRASFHMDDTVGLFALARVRSEHRRRIHENIIINCSMQ